MNNIQDQIDKLKKEMEAVKKENTVKDDFPEIKRTFEYRKTPIIKAHDLKL